MGLWWYSPSSLRSQQLCSTARHISGDNGCSRESIPTWAQLWGSINDATDDKDYWYGALVAVTYQHRNEFAHNQRRYREWLKDADTINFKAPLWPRKTSVTLFPLHTFTPAYWLGGGVKLRGPDAVTADVRGGSNKGLERSPWNPWLNLEPSGSSSGVYSLYPPTKRCLNSLRPRRGPGEDLVRFRCPSTWAKHNKIQQRSGRSQRGNGE